MVPVWLGVSFAIRAKKAIAATLAGNAALKELDLSWNNLRQESAAAIGRALSSNSGLEALNLAHNAFNNLPSQEVGDSLRTNRTLKVRARSFSMGSVSV